MNDILEKMKILNIMPNLLNLPAFPKTVKNGILFMYAGWVCFFILFLFVLKDPVEPRPAISGLLACYCIMMLRNWARVLCILCNIFIIIQLLVPALTLLGGGLVVPGGVIALCVACFAISSYFLFQKETKAFFASMTPPPPSEAD